MPDKLHHVIEDVYNSYQTIEKGKDFNLKGKELHLLTVQELDSVECTLNKHSLIRY